MASRERAEGSGEVWDLSSVRRAFLFTEMGRTLGGAGFVGQSGVLLGHAKFHILSFTTAFPNHCALTVAKHQVVENVGSFYLRVIVLAVPIVSPYAMGSSLDRQGSDPPDLPSGRNRSVTFCPYVESSSHPFPIT